MIRSHTISTVTLAWYHQSWRVRSSNGLLKKSRFLIKRLLHSSSGETRIESLPGNALICQHQGACCLGPEHSLCSDYMWADQKFKIRFSNWKVTSWKTFNIYLNVLSCIERYYLCILKLFHLFNISILRVCSCI